MPGLFTVLMPLVLLTNGLAAGVLLGTQLGGFPLMAALPVDRYVHAHAFFSTRYDPFMPICLLTTTVGGVALAVVAPTPGAWALHLLGAALAGVTVYISLTRNVPINRWVRDLDPDRLPAGIDYVERRRTWGRWNSLRSWLTVAALVVNCAAVALAL
ncbi:anthrone oxygenase family protein [Actinoplanes sp. NPDC051859]|uniref:anthrone oxygenase family protein n=1 Tax=Actinoplanes sp. NPDC051859 TaxID=3363909 RepID=UPI0037A0FC98